MFAVFAGCLSRSLFVKVALKLAPGTCRRGRGCKGGAFEDAALDRFAGLTAVAIAVGGVEGEGSGDPKSLWRAETPRVSEGITGTQPDAVTTASASRTS